MSATKLLTVTSSQQQSSIVGGGNITGGGGGLATNSNHTMMMGSSQSPAITGSSPMIQRTIADCRKFSPNIFHKSKCSHCFRQREEHSAAALECNRVSRKVSKCGYLFVAPDWDFSNPLYRTKRWQRRWFVLYDDGELTYSVDDHPETIPQACVDMTKVLEVSTAEDVTGHVNSLAITAPDRVTFVKGTCSEETKWWLNILAAFPKTKGRHKRATFPGGQATTILQSQTMHPTSRNRHNSYHRDSLPSSVVAANLETIQSAWNSTISSSPNHQSNVPITTQTSTTTPSQSSSSTVIINENKTISNETNNNNKNNRVQQLLMNNNDNDETYRDENKDYSNVNHPNNNNNNSLINNKQWLITAQQSNSNTNIIQKPISIINDDKIICDDNNSHNNYREFPIKIQMRPKSLQLISPSTPSIVSAIVKKIPASSSSSSSDKKKLITPQQSTSQPSHTNNNNNNPQQYQQEHQQSQILNMSSLMSKKQSQERGDPDGGCNLDDLTYLSKTSELQSQSHTNNSIGITETDSENMAKKGWLMKQDKRNGNWTKHWFTLRGAALFFYRDPMSEERGVLDGVLDVNCITSVNEMTVTKNYGFQLITWDNQRIVLSTVSSTSRNNWINLLRSAAGLTNNNSSTTATTLTQSPNSTTINNNLTSPMIVAAQQNQSDSLQIMENKNDIDPSLSKNEIIIKDNTSDDLKREIEKDFIKSQMAQDFNGSNSSNSSGSSTSSSGPISHDSIIEQLQLNGKKLTPLTPLTPKSILFSSDEEYRTASEGGRRDSVDWGSPCSVSPPLPASSTCSSTSIIRTKDQRIRSRSNSSNRLNKRSRSSPPSSRRSTVDSVGSDELLMIHPVQEEIILINGHDGNNNNNNSIIINSSNKNPNGMSNELQSKLSVAENELLILRQVADERENKTLELLTQLERTKMDLTKRIQDIEDNRDSLAIQLNESRNKAESIIERLTTELNETHRRCKDIEDRLSRGIEENDTLYRKIREMETNGINSMNNNNNNNTNGRHTPNMNSLNRTKIKRMNSLSDLTNLNDIDPYALERDMLADEYGELKSRFEKAINEIRAMKKELKESQNQYDHLEITHAALCKDLERKDANNRSQIQMMSERIQDLTLKYTNSERQVRILKQKLAKSEKKRSLSLKGRESLTVQKDLEDKVAELEGKIDAIEYGRSSCNAPIVMKTTSSPTKSIDSAKSTNTNGGSHGTAVSLSHACLRRKSLDSPSTEAMQVLLRLNCLEKRIEKASNSNSTTIKENSNNYNNDNSNNNNSDNSSSPIHNNIQQKSDHIIERLRSLENVVVTSKDQIEQCLQQLQCLKLSKSRRSVSPIADRKDSYKFIERCLTEAVKVLRESCDNCLTNDNNNNSSSLPLLSENHRLIPVLPESNAIKLALTQLEGQIRVKLSDLLKQRRCLREHNKLTPQKNLELLAERIAFESVCFGKLRDALNRAEDPSQFGERQTQAEAAETMQLMQQLKAKLGGKFTVKSGGCIDILASVLAKRLTLSATRTNHLKIPEMSPINQTIIDDLLRQQNELHVIAKRYKNNAMENLACGLAAETLSYISSSNDAVQGAVQEAWRQAQETVNAELVQTEIAHIMLKNSARFEQSLTPAFGYTLTTQERISFENFADAVQDALRKEMEIVIGQLTHSYEENLMKMKRGKWNLHLEHERKSSEERQLLAEFADIVAHKALVDARISVLKGEYQSKDINLTKENNSNINNNNDNKHSDSNNNNTFSVNALQKYENLFAELANDLQIANPDDILAEADFNFMYKYFTNEFQTNKAEIREISDALHKLELHIGQLQNQLTSPESIETEMGKSLPIDSANVSTLHDICKKCQDLQGHIEKHLIPYAKQLHNSSCDECIEMQQTLTMLNERHRLELSDLQNSHEDNRITMLKHLNDQIERTNQLELEKQQILVKLDYERETVAHREEELEDITKKLDKQVLECHLKGQENFELLEDLAEEKEKSNELAQDSRKLMANIKSKTDEYNLLLKERDHVQEQLQKERERIRKLEKKLELLEMEHSQQIDSLHIAYKEQLSMDEQQQIHDKGDEQTFKQRYQTEIEQLRTLCEKGLIAMESSHRRIINDLEEKHRQEIERLAFEKEQALAEETQATLAALDAMRKAHQSEVQREISRFKTEFVRQFQKCGQTTGVYSKGEDEELDEIRQEILSLSEKYSIKCVEAASFEEKSRVATQQLKHFQQHVQQLEIRNKQLRAHLVSGDSDINYNTYTNNNNNNNNSITSNSPNKDSGTFNDHVDDNLSKSTGIDYSKENNVYLLQNNSPKEIHPRLKYNEGIKLASINTAKLTLPRITNNNKNTNTNSTIDDAIIMESSNIKTPSSTSTPTLIMLHRLNDSPSTTTTNSNIKFSHINNINNNNTNSNNNNNINNITEDLNHSVLKMCSLPPLDGKDVEHIRRFELEI